MLLGVTGYFGYKISTLNATLATEISQKEALKASSTESLTLAQGAIVDLQTELSLTSEDLFNLENDYRQEKDKNDAFQEQINTLMGTVGNLDKLSKTDKELLQKYSKVYFLNENYTPANIKPINEKYILEGREPQFFQGDALPFLTNMIDRARRANIDLQVVSAYRSFDTQGDLKGNYTQTYGSGANTFSADQGYSEHQLGTTLDFSDAATNGPYLSFQDTESYNWLLKNAYRYGFTLSYPDNNGFYIFEPWHWRFVGTDLARYLHNEGLHFYDMDQREIDTYLIKIFD